MAKIKTRNQLLIIGVMASMSVNGQYVLKSGSMVQIDTSNGSLSAMSQNANLTCGAPGTGDTIQYLTCGDGTTTGPDGTCITAGPTEPFQLDYGLSNAASCDGVDGTPEWQGSHPIGIGTGDFSYTLMNGITQPTQYTLSCLPQNTVHNFSRVLHQGSIDLRNMIESGRVLSSLFDQYRTVNMTGGDAKIQDMNYQLNTEDPMSARFIIKQHGDELHALPTSGAEAITLSPPDRWFDENVATYMFITGERPKPNSIPQSRAKGACDVLSLNNDAKLQVTTSKGQGGCYVSLGDSAYLVWYLMEK